MLLNLVQIKGKHLEPKPNRTFHSGFFILIGTELLVERFTNQKLYRLPDAISNINCGITSQLSGLFLKIFGIGVYQFLFEKFAFFTLETAAGCIGYRSSYWLTFPILSFLLPGFTRYKDNMRIFKWLSPIILVLILCFACGKPLPTLEGIDLARWQEDRNACNNLRASMREAIDHEKEKLLALKQMQIVELLGRPDQNELYSRNQKFFYYFLEPAPACEGTTDSTAEKLVIRFNAMGLAKEVSVE